MDRCACQRGCTGPVLRPIQRYGKLGKRSWNGTPTPDDRTKYNMKDTRYMYLSFDEAGTHVNQRTFRLVVSIAYDGGRHTTTGVSPPVRVLANNDVPTGAAHMHIMVNMPSSWAGWQTAMAPESLAARLVAAAMDTPQLIRTPHANRRMQSDGDDSNSDDEYRRGTPMRNPNYGPTAPSPYSTRRSTAAASGRPPLSPMGGASAPSSLLVDGSGTRMTPGVESASRPLEPSGGSLALWLGVAQELHDQGEKPPAPVNPAAPVPAHHSLATATAHVTLGSRSLDVKRPRTMGDVAAAGNLPHSVDFEPNFPAFLGPQTGVPSAYQRIHMMQGGAPGGHAVQAGHHGPNDDPIAAFVQLMMMQTPNPEAAAPIVELPAVSQGEHPGMNVNQYAAAMEKLMGAGNASPIHRTMMHNVPGTPPSFATPTPSALDELFGGVHASEWPDRLCGHFGSCPALCALPSKHCPPVPDVSNRITTPSRSFLCSVRFHHPRRCYLSSREAAHQSLCQCGTRRHQSARWKLTWLAGPPVRTGLVTSKQHWNWQAIYARIAEAMHLLIRMERNPHSSTLLIKTLGRLRCFVPSRFFFLPFLS